jgi:GntR family transcriptional repressor for pyruvate dehydrogenase complex
MDSHHELKAIEPAKSLPHFTGVEREPLYEQVANELIHFIVQDSLPVGTRLPSERSLSEQFGVSRVVIREAMKVLVKLGLITVEPGRGTFISDRINESLLRSLDLVRRIQGLDSSKLWEVRTPLEIVVAGLAAQRATAGEIAILEACTNDMEKYIDDQEKHRAANEKFHLTLANATRNEFFPTLLRPLVGLMTETRILMSQRPEAARVAVESHRRLVEAIKQRDVQRAEEEMRAHMENGTRFLALALAGRSDPAQSNA